MRLQNRAASLSIALAGLTIVLVLIAIGVVPRNANETWSGWFQAIGTIDAIAAGWIFVVWQNDQHLARDRRAQRNAAVIVGWRIFTDILQVQVHLQREFRWLLHVRRDARRTGHSPVRRPFNKVGVPNVLHSSWPEFKNFEGQAGASLAQALGMIDKYNLLAAAPHERFVAVTFIEDEARLLLAIHRTLRKAHRELSRFLDEEIKRHDVQGAAGER